MKRILVAFALVTMIWPFAIRAQGRFETIMLNADVRYGPISATNELRVESFEVAELVARDINSTYEIEIEKDGVLKRLANLSPIVNDLSGKLIIKGPALIRTSLPDGVGTAFLTFRLQPERFDPNQTQFISPQDGNVNVQMECSTNLLNWAPATNGVYAVASGAKFFRLRLDRVN